MAEMYIPTPDVLKILVDYDIVFSSGIMLPVTLDATLGDTIEDRGDTLFINLTAKPSLSDSSKTLPAEEITVFKAQVVSIQKRTREVVQLNPEQQAEWRKTIKELSSTVQ
jgi:hypothetical protein